MYYLNGDIKDFPHTQTLEQPCIINSTKAVAFTWMIPLYGFIHICSIKSVCCLDVVGWHTLYSVSVNNTTGKYYTIAHNFKNVHRTTLVHNSSFDSNWPKQKQAGVEPLQRRFEWSPQRPAAPQAPRLLLCLFSKLLTQCANFFQRKSSVRGMYIQLPTYRVHVHGMTTCIQSTST